MEIQVGLEISPLNLTNEDDTLWLLALTAPNNAVNQQQVRTAISLAQETLLKIRPGCVLETLATTFRELPISTTPVVFHSLTTHHLQEQGKFEPYKAILRELSLDREFFEASVEWSTMREGYGKPIPIHLYHWRNGQSRDRFFGVCDPAADGRWIISAGGADAPDEEKGGGR